MKRGIKHTKHFLEGWKNRSTVTEKDLLQCLRPRFLPNSRHTNNNIDFVRSKLLSLKQNDFSERNIFNACQERKITFLRGQSSSLQVIRTLICRHRQPYFPAITKVTGKDFMKNLQHVSYYIRVIHLIITRGIRRESCDLHTYHLSFSLCIHIFPFKTGILYDCLRVLQLVRSWTIILKESLTVSVMTDWIKHLLCKCEGWTQIPETQIKNTQVSTATYL